MRLYRYFETASSIFLLLEYARGGRLWDHISCYQRNKESNDYFLGKHNKGNTQNLEKSARDQTEKTSAIDSATVNANRLSPQVAEKPLSPENTPLESRTSNLSTNSARLCSPQVSEDPAKVSNACVVEPELKSNSDGITVLRNGNNNESGIDAKEVQEINKESVNECREKTVETSRDNKHLLFSKLDEYFASSAQRIPDEHVKIWAAELVLAVAYLHSAGIICR